MFKNKISSLLVLSFLVFSLLPISSIASSPGTVSGYVYANDVICEPNEVVLSFPDQDISADLFPGGFYVIDFSADIGDEGIFIVTVGEEDYTAEETITIEQGTISYDIDLHITIPEDDIENPSKVTGLSVTDAKDGKLDLSWNTATDNVAVDFYNIYRDGILIDTESTTSYQDTGLTNGQSYCYNVSAVDTSSNEGEKSDIECGIPTENLEPNNPPNKPVNPKPENNSEDIVLNPQLSVFVTDPDEDSLTVYFYNASDEALIASVTANNGTNATVTWSNLAFNTSYQWYAVANDTEYEAASDTFTFKTIEIQEDNTKPVVSFEKPEEGSLYLFDSMIFSGILRIPFIIGDINVIVKATDNESGISKVELSIKGLFTDINENLTEYPYQYNWSSFSFGKYNLTATAYDMSGNYANTSIIVRKFL